LNQNPSIGKNQVTILHPKIENPKLNSDLIGLIDSDFGLYFGLIGLIGLIDSIGSIGLYFGLIDLFPMIDFNYMNLYIIGLDFIFYILLFYGRNIQKL